MMIVIEDCIIFLGKYKARIIEQENSIELFNKKLNSMNEKISNLEKNIFDNSVFMSEEINDIYPAIKAINIEIMNIKNKNL